MLAHVDLVAAKEFSFGWSEGVLDGLQVNMHALGFTRLGRFLFLGAFSSEEREREREREQEGVEACHN